MSVRPSSYNGLLQTDIRTVRTLLLTPLEDKRSPKCYIFQAILQINNLWQKVNLHTYHICFSVVMIHTSWGVTNGGRC